MDYLFGFSMFTVSVMLILIILVQRGRGGGLSGALGGMGGQSAFGTKAGDLFTRITIVLAAVWILLCVAAVKYYASREDRFGTGSSGTHATVPGPAGAPGPAKGGAGGGATGGSVPKGGVPKGGVPKGSAPAGGGTPAEAPPK